VLRDTTVLMLGAMLFAAAANAHTHLDFSAPADKSRVPAPQAIELQFSEVTRVTSLTLQQGTSAPQSLPLPAKATQHVSVPVPGLAQGEYKVSWRVVGADGHVVSGTFGFTIDPAAKPPAIESKPAAPATDHRH
jgi:methionine-rich copper-binding protein CopC